jgi:8-oxo-dGTP pyrophosphatase MutT (NUDIX family)
VERTIRFPNGKVVDFDLVGMAGAGSAVVIFAWDSLQKTATLVREYHPGPNKFLFGAAAGIVEDDKHNGNVELAAQHELEEECHLAGGSWHLLTPKPLAMDKYSTTTIRAFLVIDASHVPDPRPQDHEEDIEIIQNVSVDEIMTMIRRGEMNVVGAWACLMAIAKLREMGEIE